jgi:hypothetical protein
MNGVSRRNIEMGKTTVEFNRLHADTDEGNVVAAKILEDLVARAIRLTTKQREGLIDKSAASARKRELRQQMLAGAISHLAYVGRLASREDHELGKSFIFKPSANTFLAFLSAAQSMATAAQEHKQTLMKYGLSGAVLDEFVQSLAQFETTVTLGTNGRNAHKGATAELIEVSKEIGQIVRVMDARNRQRFQADGELLNAWISASTVLGTPRTVPAPKDTGTSNEDSTPSSSTDVRPAA